jgi:hypothetical protein
MHEGEFPPNTVLGNSELLATVAALGQALLVNLQLRFSIPNAHERTRASFSTVLRSSVSANPYEKVHVYLTSSTRYEVFQKERTVTGMLG